MTKLTLRTIPDAVLRQKAKPVEKVDARIVKLMRDMLETMYADNGVGLAANQVGVLERVIVIDASDDRDGKDALLMANPEILEKSEETYVYKEGCLSVPDHYANVTRAKKIRVAYLNEKGERKEIDAEDFLSVCLQHEMDHLDGVLFIDHLSKLKRDIIIKKICKAQKDEA